MIDFKKLAKIQDLIQFKVQENREWLSYGYEFNPFSHNIVIRLSNIKTGATHMSAYDIEEMLSVSLEDLNIHIDTIIEELKNK